MILKLEKVKNDELLIASAFLWVSFPESEFADLIKDVFHFDLLISVFFFS